MSAPLVVNTRDGVCWTRRAVTSAGIALYAPEKVKTCPQFVMATLPELAEQGIAGSADALPMPMGPEPQAPSAERRDRYAKALFEWVNGAFAWETSDDQDSWRAEADAAIAVADAEQSELRTRVAELEVEREKLVRWHGEDSKTITTLVARVDRHRARLVALQNDALSMRGALSPNGEARKVPMPLGETLTPAVEWLINRVAELEARLAEHDRPVDEDPIAYALTEHAELLADRYRAEGLAEATTWLVKKAREFRAMGGEMRAAQADAVAAMASKVERGAVRPDNLRMLPAGFFEPGHAYTHRPGPDDLGGPRLRFYCESVTTDKATGQPVARGWGGRRYGDRWTSVQRARGLEDWQSGAWVDTTTGGDDRIGRAHV